MIDKPTLVVIGGGVAGLTAAVTAADAGWAVTVLEARARLGGATHSFTRAFDDGEVIVDNGQHVFLRCCTAYREFLHRLGVENDTVMQSRLDVPVFDPTTGRGARLRRDRLPAPLHLSRALLRYRLLTPMQRVRAIVAALMLNRVDRNAPSSDAQTFRSWLKAHGQSDAAIERLFDVFTVATLNAPAAQVSLSLGAMVFQDGLLREADACDIGMARVPLGQLHGDAAAAALSGHDIKMRTPVRAVTQLPGNRWQVETDDASIEADAVVLAVPHDVAADLLPAGAIADPDVVRGLDVAPILNVHVIFDRVVLTEPFIAAVGSPAQFVFDRTAPSGLREGTGQYVAVSVSAADQWIDAPVARLREVFMPELRKLLPAARDAHVLDFFVTREREATFRPVPGSAARRLGPATALPGLVVAGAWTATGWPATMESAVRSGLAAIDELQKSRRTSPADSRDVSQQASA
ncbi:MAG TPA: hydroxysqualene dehydroxylase HpnE [Acidothermaceae bacterium]